MSESEVKAEFELFGTILANNHQNLEKTVLRKIEHEAYLAAAKCTENNSRGTFETRNCIKTSFDLVEKAQQIVAQKQAEIGKALNSCQKSCENMTMEASSEAQRDVLQKQFYNCILDCPRTTIPLVEDSFRNLTSELESLK